MLLACNAGSVDGSGHRYYLRDPLGSVRAVVDESGTAVETRDYYPFGLPLDERYDEEGTREDYTGHACPGPRSGELDTQTQLHYAGKDAAVGYRSVRSKPSASGFKKVTPSTVAPVEKSSLSTVGIWFSFAAAQIWASR